MQKRWINYLWSLKEYSIRNFEEFLELNTYMLTPEVSLPTYLGLKRKNVSKLEQEKEQEKLRDIFIKLNEIKHNCKEVLKNDPSLIDFLISVGLSYELISRLLIYMKQKGFLTIDISLPSSNLYENIKSKEALRSLVASVLCDMLSTKLSEKLIGEDELLQAIYLEIKNVEKVFSSIVGSMQKMGKTYMNKCLYIGCMCVQRKVHSKRLLVWNMKIFLEDI